MGLPMLTMHQQPVIAAGLQCCMLGIKQMDFTSDAMHDAAAEPPLQTSQGQLTILSLTAAIVRH
jgi:hypothetical protein